MEGPGAITHGTVPAAFVATAEAIDAHTDELGSHADTLDTHTSQITTHTSQIGAINSVPAGLIAGFANAAAIPAGWSRFTNGDGKFLIGAGTSFSQTFVEGASAGSSWTHQHGVSFTSGNNSPASGAVASGGGSTAVPTHTHSVSGNTADATWIPPSFTVVWGLKA